MLPIPYCYITDTNYLDVLIGSVNSLIKNFPHDSEPVIYIVTEAGNSFDKQPFLSEILDQNIAKKIEWLSCDLPCEKSELSRSRIPSTTYLRFALPNLFIGRHDFVFYVDGDTLIEGDPANSVSIKETFSLMASPSSVGHDWGYIYPEAEQSFEGVKATDKYFNSGVLLLNVKELYREGFTRKCVALQKKYQAKTRFMDQDIINLAVLREWKQLPWKFNVTSGWLYPYPVWKRPARYKKFREIEAPKILHFTGPRKGGRGGLFNLPVRFYYEKCVKRRVRSMDYLRFIFEAIRDDLINVWNRIAH